MSPPPHQRDGPPYGDWRDHTTTGRTADRPDRRETDVVGGRIVAQIVDLVVQFVQLVVVGLVLVVLLRPDTRNGVAGMMALSILALPLYGAILESRWNGQTVGKRLAGVQVVDERGNPPSFGQALTRNLPAVIVFSWVAIVIALASIAMTERRQRLFDLVAGTYVVAR